MCDHVQDANPRHDHGDKFDCMKCGRLVAKPDQGHRARQPAFEKALVDKYADDGGLLSAFAQQRAFPGPVDKLLTRNFPQDIGEEFGDVGNYGPWGVQQLAEYPHLDEAVKAEMEMWVGMCLRAAAQGLYAASQYARLWNQNVKPRIEEN